MPARAQTTLVLKKEELNLCRRGDSGNWQCHFKIAGQWYRKSTGETDQTEATHKAWEFFYGGRQKNSEGLPIMNKSFKDFAQLAIERMERANKAGTGKSVYKEHIGTIKNYLIPALGQRAIKAIDGAALEHLDQKRQEIMGKTPRKSTIQSHNAALQLVFTEAINRGYMHESDRPKLKVSGAESQRRPDFTLEEAKFMLEALKEWSEQGRNVEKSKHRRLLLRDYVEILLNTGVRTGEEILNLRWREIQIGTDPHPTETNRYWSDEAKDYIETPVQQRVIRFELRHWKDKRTHETRTVVGFEECYQAFMRIARRQYGHIHKPLPILSYVIDDSRINNDFVFRILDDEHHVEDLQKVWDRFLEKYNLTICPRTRAKRTLYSLRHTYVTLRLVYEGTSIHTLARQLGTSVEMIQRHYSHLDAYLAREQLRGDNLRQQIDQLDRPSNYDLMIDLNEPPDDEM